jgi:hypothetical protein
MKNILLNASIRVFITFLAFSCTSKSDDTEFETNADVVKSYAGKNYQLIAFETQIRYGNQLYYWKKGSRPTWIGNRYEKYVAMDMKDIFDTTAIFQITNLNSSSEKKINFNSANLAESFQTFDFIKLNKTENKSHKFFKAIYQVNKDGEFINPNASIRYFPLTFPEKYQFKFSQDTLDVIYDNTKSALGAESIALRLKLID